MAADNTTVTPCPGCGQKVRFPTDRGFIKFKCPACKAGLEWGTPPAEADIMDVVVESKEPTNNIPAAGTTASVLLPSAPPRLASLLYLAGSVGAAFATYWLDKNANENMLMILGFMVALVYAYYLFFRAIRVATRFGVGGSIAVLAMLAVILPFAMPYVSELGLNSFDNPFTPTTLAEGHFKGASRNTTPSEMDKLMEGW